VTHQGGPIAAGLAVLALLVSAGTTLAAPVYRDPPGYQGIAKVPKLKLARVPPSVPLAPKGTFPDVLVDEAGTAHIVWNDGRGDLDDAAVYCRLRRGAKACDAVPFPLTWNPPYGAGDGPQFNVDDIGPKIVRIGNQLVVFSKRYPTTQSKPDGASSSTVVAWTSSDGGQHWADATIVGKWNVAELAVLGPPADPTILALGQDPFCGSAANMCVTAYKSGLYAAGAGDISTGPNQSYDPSLALDANGRPVAAFNDLASNIIIRRWNGTGSVIDPGQWSAPAPGLKGGELALAGGPSGLFIMSRPGFGKDYELRRLNPADNAFPPGPPVKVSAGDDPIFEELVQDASGRLLAAWQQRGGKDPGVKLRVTRPTARAAQSAGGPPVLGAAQTLFTGPGNGQLALAAGADGGGFAVANHTGGINAEGEIVATGFGAATPTGKPGLGGLEGGGGPSSACGTITFGKMTFATDGGGCFFQGQAPHADTFVSSGAIDLYGLKIVPDAGVSLVIDPKRLTIDAVGGPATVKVILSSSLTGDITLWHGTFRRDLSKVLPGTELFSFDSSAFLAKVLGFDIAKNITVRLNRQGDGIEVPVSLTLPAGFGGAAAAATLTADRARGLHIDSLHLHLGPVTIGVATLDNFDLEFQGADQLWAGKGTLAFAGAGTIDAAAEFRMGDFKEAHVSFAPAVPPLIGPFVYLLRADVGFGVNPLFVELGGALGAGAAVNGVSPVTMDGTGRLTIPDNGKPIEFRAGGKVTVVIFKAVTGNFRYQHPGYADFDLTTDQDLEILRLNAKLQGFVDADNGEWGGDFTGSACFNYILGCLGGSLDAAASAKGLAICGQVKVPGYSATAGVQLPWVDLEDLTTSIAAAKVIPVPLLAAAPAAVIVAKNIKSPCHTSAYRKPPPRASSAQAGAAPAITVGGGLPSATVLVFGDQGVPSADLVGAGGAVVTGPAPGAPAARSAGGTAIALPAANAVMFVADQPRAGTWTIRRRAGSAVITEVLQSDGYRPATARATVLRKGRKRSLRYRVTDLGSGQRVEFIERAQVGSRSLGFAKGASGVLPIRPTDQPGGQRSIFAQVRRGGLVTGRTLVARYQAVGPSAPGAVPGLRIARTGRVVTVSWRAARGAARYQVRLRGKGTSQVVLAGARSRRVRFDAIGRTVRLTVEVRALSRTLRRGAARSAVSIRARR
jgi:hypothetical protein